MKRDPTISESALRPAADDDDETSAGGERTNHRETPETVLAAKEIAQRPSNSAMEALPELRQAVTLREIEG
jgi:RNA polymerase sigma-70 factor (ECF subfamily)